MRSLSLGPGWGREWRWLTSTLGRSGLSSDYGMEMRKRPFEVDAGNTGCRNYLGSEEFSIYGGETEEAEMGGLGEAVWNKRML